MGEMPKAGEERQSEMLPLPGTHVLSRMGTEGQCHPKVQDLRTRCRRQSNQCNTDRSDAQMEPAADSWRWDSS